MSQNTYKTFLEATSFKSLKNVADVARQVMLGEDQEKQEIQELVNIINSAKYVSEEKKEIIIIAPKSSIIASATKKTFNDIGLLEPRRDSTPIEKAMSVAEGIAQPFKV